MNNFYSSLGDSMHIIFLGLLNDATYMLKKNITQTKIKTNETRVTDTEAQKKNTAVSSKNQKWVNINVKQKLKNLTLTKSEPQFTDILPQKTIPLKDFWYTKALSNASKCRSKFGEMYQ